MLPKSSSLELRSVQVGPWPTTAYGLVCPVTRFAVLIDPGADPDSLAAMMGDSTPIAILLTHSHPDHIGALESVRLDLGVPVMAHPGPHHENVDLRLDHSLADGEAVAIGDHRVRVVYAPGHTPDQVCFVLEQDHRVIVGDTIFEGGPGNTAAPEDFEITLDTLSRVVLRWPDESVCYPGHGPSFRLGDSRSAINQFLAGDHGDFFGDATWDM